MDTEDFCSSGYNAQFKQTYDDPIDRFTIVQQEQQYLISNFNKRLSGVQMLYEQPNLCKNKVRDDIVMITFEIESPKAVVAKHDVTVTFFEQVALLGNVKSLSFNGENKSKRRLFGLGGTIGLFCGLSLVSLVEMGFWIFRFFMSMAFYSYYQQMDFGHEESEVEEEEEVEEVTIDQQYPSVFAISGLATDVASAEAIEEEEEEDELVQAKNTTCLLYTSPSPRDRQKSRMPSSA